MRKTLMMIIIISMCLIGIYPVNHVEADETTQGLQLYFSSNPLVVSPGVSGYFELTIKNIGNSMVRYIDITPDIKDPEVIKWKGNWDVYIGDLDGGSQTTVYYEYKITDDAEPGLYQVTFEVDSNIPGDIKQTQMVKVIDNGNLDIAKVSPRVINIGTETTVTFTISNNGGRTIRNVLFSWVDNSSSILPTGGDNRYMIDAISAYNTTNLSIEVFADPSCAAGIYPLSITLQYYDATGSMERFSSHIGMQISGGTDFEVVVEDSSSGSITLAVSNIGANTASSMIITIPDQPSYSTIGAGSANIGNLDAGDYTLATFTLSQISVNGSSDLMIPGDMGGFNFSQRPFRDSNLDMSERPDFMNRTFPSGMNMGSVLLMDISYTDLFGNRQTVQKEVPMSSISYENFDSSSSSFDRYGSQFSGQTEDSSSGLDTGTTYILIGVIGIILVVVIVKFDKVKTIPKKMRSLKGKKP